MKRDLRGRLESLRRSGELAPAANILSNGTPPPQGFLFPGEEHIAETPAGPCYLRELVFPTDHRHGSACLSRVLEAGTASLPLPLGTDLKETDPGRALFIDIETTGLAGGTGTWAFLIGLGWFAEKQFRLRQYFMRRPAEERAMLHHFGETAAAFPHVISFNGRSFDVPILWNRQILARTPHRLEPRSHLDLLPWSRRLYRERVISCSLRSLEGELLGLHRRGDIPGEEIPAVYFAYLRRGETGRLREVFQHNVLDILSMVTLLGQVVQTSSGAGVEHPAECFALGRLYRQSGSPALAEEWFRQAAAAPETNLARRSLLELSFIMKSQDRWEEAAAAWQELLAAEPADLTPFVELAKYHEHRRRDCRAALGLARAALSRAESRNYYPASGQAGIAALRHRITRLERKLAGNHENPAAPLPIKEKETFANGRPSDNLPL